jgi:hypothetical protein
MLDGTFEQVVRSASADGAGDGPDRVAGGAKAAAEAQLDARLLRRPRVFTLAVVWESPQVRGHQTDGLTN